MIVQHSMRMSQSVLRTQLESGSLNRDAFDVLDLLVELVIPSTSAQIATQIFLAARKLSGLLANLGGHGA